MIKVENVEVVGWEPAIRGMRNPKNSWDRSDSKMIDIPDINGEHIGTKFVIGENDLKLMRQLYKAGSVHRKFMRMITVYCDITASHTWWAEFDTYKVGTVRNSCSKMHKIHVKEFVKDDFDHEGIDAVGGVVNDLFADLIGILNYLRDKFNETHEKKYWRAMIELLPMGYKIKATVELNYEVLANMYQPDNRRYHKLDEWCIHEEDSNREYFTDYGFCDFIESLPYFLDIVSDNH